MWTKSRFWSPNWFAIGGSLHENEPTNGRYFVTCKNSQCVPVSQYLRCRNVLVHLLNLAGDGVLRGEPGIAHGPCPVRWGQFGGVLGHAHFEVDDGKDRLP